MRQGIYLLIACILLFPAVASAGGIVLHSGPEQVHLLELFTSEGCSSCPPAETRLSSLKTSPGLWKAVVPVSFHVDYWDNLGWPDRFASPAYTQRQRGYAAGWGSDSVYTPEFVLDGLEFHGGDIPAAAGPGGSLTVELGAARQLTVRYSPALANSTGPWEAHIALLGIGLETDVRAGENGGRRLRHDFVALSLSSLPLTSLPLEAATNAASMTLPVARDGEKAIAVWITQTARSTPVQAAGGWE